MKAFSNIDRTRHYGIRVGDIVEERAFGHVKKGEVMSYGFGDNNCVYMNIEGDITVKAIPEWCDIITKVEDRTDKFKEMTFLIVTGKNGYRDYEIYGFFTVKRACVSPTIKIGDIFNVYYGESTKIGVEWRGDLKTSLIAIEGLFEKNV